MLMEKQKLRIDFLSKNGHDPDEYDPDNQQDIDRLVSKLKDKLTKGYMFVVGKCGADGKVEADDEDDFIIIKRKKKDGTKKTEQEIKQEVESKHKDIEDKVKDKQKDKKLVAPPVKSG